MGIQLRFSGLFLVLALCAGCGGGEGDPAVSVGPRHDAGDIDGDEKRDGPASSTCDSIRLDGSSVIEEERDFTARFRAGESYTKTVMLFGGESVDEDNVLSNAYVLGLDKMDALKLAEVYEDFYLCSSAGGQAAAELVHAYDLVFASCEVYDQLVAALRHFHRNRAAGGDRTSIRFEGAPLELESVVENASGADVTDQVSDQEFHLVRSIEQLTGESVLSFGTSN